MTKKELIIVLSIVAFDLITKLTANYYLPFEEDFSIIGNKVSLYLTYNQGATGGQAGYFIEGESNKNMTIVQTCISGLILLSYILYIRKKELRTIYKILIGIVLYVSLTILIEVTREYLSTFVISSWITSVTGKLTALTIYACLFYLTRDKWIKFSSLLILSCGIGNLLSHFYLPYKVIDFIYIEGTYELLRIGVFNFADLAFDIGIIGLIISVIALLYRKLKFNKSKPIKAA